MTKYIKINEIVNIEVTAKYKSGFETWKTKYGSDEFLIGRVKDWKKPPEEEGNFEVSKPEKGVKVKDRKWETIPYIRDAFQNSYNWTFIDKSGEELKLELSWLQNKNLTEKLPEQMPADGVKITPHIDGKTVNFSVSAPKKIEDPQVQSQNTEFDSMPDIDVSNLPF